MLHDVLLGALQSYVVWQCGCGRWGCHTVEPQSRRPEAVTPQVPFFLSPVLDVGSCVARGSEDGTWFFWFPAGQAPSSQPPSGAIWPCTRVEEVAAACRLITGPGEVRLPPLP